MLEEKGEYTGVRVMRKHVGWYLKGMRGAAEMRRRINEMESADEIFSALDSLLNPSPGKMSGIFDSHRRICGEEKGQGENGKR